MELLQPMDAFRRNLKSGFAEEHVGEQSATHADLAVNAPDRQFDVLRFEGFAPSEHVLIDAVDKCPVEIEQECGVLARHLAILQISVGC